MNILVTNDDGIFASGVEALTQVLQHFGNVYVVCPDQEKSAVGHAITLRTPLKLTPVDLFPGSKGVWSVNGTPADCVKLGVEVLLKEKPDILFSGINLGPNLGRDIYYSGTMAGAVEASLYHVPAVAVSLQAFNEKKVNYTRVKQLFYHVADMWVMILLCAALLFAGCSQSEESSASQEQDHEAPDTQVEERAGVSGILHFYTSQPDEDAQALVEAFTAHYPEVQVDIFRSGTEEVIAKIQAEHMAGGIQADVLLVADAVTFESLKEEGLLLAYHSSQAADIPAEFVDPDGYYYGTKVITTAMAVNSNLVTEMPSSWHVLSSEEARGKGIMPSPFYSGAAAYNVGVMSRNDAFGWDFFEALKANDMTVTQGNGGVLQAVASGEKAYGVVVDFLVARAKQEGSPVELIYPEEGVPAITEPIGIVHNTENITAAQAFVDFVLSEQGQQLAVRLGYTPIRSGLSTPEGLKSVDELNILTADISELYQYREQDKQQFGNIFGQQ